MSVIEKATAHDYQALTEDSMKAMVQSALLELEKMHFETKMNVTLNSRDHVQQFEDGSSMKLGNRLDDLEQKIERFKAEFSELL